MTKETCTTINHNDFALLYDVNDMGGADKFVNTMISQKINDILSGKVDVECNVFKQWRAQSDFNFGFVPLSDFISVENEAQDPEIQCPFTSYKHVKASGVPNFLKSRIPVRTQLNVKQWENVLQGYWDTQLLDLLKYGFPLDFNRDVPLKCDKINHKSALLYPKDIEAYLNEERQYGAILGPYENFPIDQCHSSAFMTREKPNAVHRSVIIDLSWPKGASINVGIDKNSYLGTDFVLTFSHSRSHHIRNKKNWPWGAFVQN